MSEIDAKYAELGGPAGFLGNPVTAESICPDGVGHYRHFEHGGSIYWTPATGAQEVHGCIGSLRCPEGVGRPCVCRAVDSPVTSHEEAAVARARPAPRPGLR
jgi:hypothetical protein